MTFPRVPMKVWVAVYAVALFLAAASFFSQTRVEAAHEPSFVNSLSSSGAKQTAIVLTVPTSVIDDDLMIAHLAIVGGSGTTVTGVVVGWTIIGSAIDTTTDLKTVLYKKVASSETAGTTTYAFDLSGNVFSVGAITAFRGVDPTTPIDVSAEQANGSAATSTAPSITTTVDHTMLIAFFSQAVGAAFSTPTSPASMTMAYTSTSTGANGGALGAAYVGQTSAGSTGDIVSASDKTDVGTGHLIALRPIVGPVDNPRSPTSTSTLGDTALLARGLPRKSTVTFAQDLFTLGFPRTDTVTFTESFGQVIAFNRTSTESISSTAQVATTYPRKSTVTFGVDLFGLGFPRTDTVTFTSTRDLATGVNKTDTAA